MPSRIIKWLISPFYFYLMCIVILFYSCSDITTFHITDWQTGFFLNDSTLGVLGWEYDKDESSTDWTLSDYYNVKQYFYEYNINNKNLTNIYTLRSIEVLPSDYNNMAFHYPWLYYYTHTNSHDIGAYNLITQENKIINSEGGYRGMFPVVVSTKGRYLGFTYAGHPDHEYCIYDLQEGKDIFGSFLHRPIAIDDSLKKAVLIFPDNTQDWFLTFDMQTKKIDTLAENTYGYVDYHVSNNIVVFRDSNNTWNYFLSSELLSGKFEYYEIKNLDKARVVVDVNLGINSAVFPVGSDIKLVNYKDNYEEIILEYSKEEK